MDRQTLSRARLLKLEAELYLAQNDSYTAMSLLGDCLVTGPTGTNVNDMLLILARRRGGDS